MDRDTAVREAAEAVLKHGGPECRTDPHGVLDALLDAYEAGATTNDVRAEMARQRTT